VIHDISGFQFGVGLVLVMLAFAILALVADMGKSSK
jgi:hypothetical protein